MLLESYLTSLGFLNLQLCRAGMLSNQENLLPLFAQRRLGSGI